MAPRPRDAVHRLRTWLLLRSGIFGFLRDAWSRDDAKRAELAGKAVERLEGELRELRAEVRRLAVVEARNEVQQAQLAGIGPLLAAPTTADHIRDAVRLAPLLIDPAPHLIVDGLLPPEVYRALLDALPPPECFTTRDPVKQDLELADLARTPRLSREAWGSVDRELVPNVVLPALFARLRPYVEAHYAAALDPVSAGTAAALPHQTVSGRLMLRRPGYHLEPHLDPKRVVITGLLYLARDGDPEEFGTQFFRVAGSFVSTGMKTFFPEAHGLRCELATTVPFRANRLVAFVNSGAAHGATLPASAPLQERYSLQFYVKAPDAALQRLIARLPAERRAEWDGLARK